MKIKLLIFALLFSLGCERGRELTHNLSKPNEKIMIQIICCAPGHINPANTATCATLATVPDNASTINGVRVWGVQKPGDCVNLDETPFWGEP